MIHIKNRHTYKGGGYFCGRPSVLGNLFQIGIDGSRDEVIDYSDDNFKAIAKKFGKSVSEASLSTLIGMLNYKCRTGGRESISVKSFKTTMTCSTCGALTGPTGLAGLKVRHWICSCCGQHHDRDFNSSCVVFNAGAGTAHEKELRNVA